MKLIQFDKWTDKTVNVHAHGFTQTINEHNVNVFLFGFRWKVLSWTEYINHFHDKA